MWHKPQLLNAFADLLILAASAMLLGALAIWAMRVPSLPINQVIFLEPLAHTRRADVEQQLLPVLRGNFFSISLDQVRGNLERLPWVRHATVRRIWPAKLEVTLEEHVAVARWGEMPNEMVNSFGEVFSAGLDEGEQARLPRLAGPQGAAPVVLRRYAELVEQFAAIGERPQALALSSRLAWQVQLGNGMAMELGREQQKSSIGSRLQRFIEVYPDTVGKREPKPTVVDLRYPNGFAMKVAAEVKGK